MLHHTTKYDGSLHYRYLVEPLVSTESAIAVYRPTGVLQQTYRGDFVSDLHVLQFYFANTHCNIAVGWEHDWTPRMHYVNIATPASWDEERLEAIDLDIDLILPARSHEIIIDDEDEFEEHIGEFCYPAELVALCRAETARLHRIISDRIGVFGSDIFGWRPGDPVDPIYLAPPI